MAIRVALTHRTCYRYAKPVWLSPHLVRLRPAPHCRTPILSYSLGIEPREHFINWQQDPYSNQIARLVFPARARELQVTVDLVAELTVINPFDFFVEGYAETFPFAYDEVLVRELRPYLELQSQGPRFHALVEEMRGRGVRTVDYLVQLNQLLSRRISYVIRLEPGIQTCEATIELQSGSCRDSAWLEVQLLRHLGLAARFVSGYLIQLKPDVRSLDGPTGAEEDFTDLHAWAEAYVPGAGWVGLDPTSGLLAGEGHLPLACAAEPVLAAPITGSFSADDAEVVTSDLNHDVLTPPQMDAFEHSMSVTRVHEDPRVTRPYTERQWSEIDALGQRIDEELRAGDVRLTMGGEPTFVSIDDYDSPEWTSAALGPKKRELALRLLKRLHDRFAPGALQHYGQGKWYPGESLPRWELGLYWRPDGVPVWSEPSLVAAEDGSHGHGADEARAFIERLALRLGVSPRFVQSAFEDAWYYLWRERRLPSNVDPFDSRLEDPEERARLAKVFEQGLDAVVGHALPLQRGGEAGRDGAARWVSGPWLLRAERLFLIPGDSPMGYRLPLDSQPWAEEGDREPVHDRDPWEPREPLPSRERLPRQRIVEQTLDAVAGEATRVPGPQESAHWIVRTALCVEARGGVLRVFLPPLRRLEDYLELVSNVEATAAELKLPVMVEGYPPPQDLRLSVLKVTPDPGVIEVNVHPSASWEHLRDKTAALYEEARLCRLGTEKFLIDGRHTGTGGGNHIVVGGPTPADSPLLRRPDLLGSLVRYWHNHPSLSYLFSGLFVGPTSQAPRLDEGRADHTYEMELALRQLPAGESAQPWLVDRVLRHLLVDVTGNTHRAEFCIDKLYSPEAASGRLGLLEMRAFEMPPHWQMSLTQHLLLRALIARFWEQPYRQPLVRWGTQLHDRFLLPHFVGQDLEDVIEELNEAGYPLGLAWFAPHLEFRFPLYGAVVQRGIELELRQAIEPWHVLGEEGTGGGTVRFVDSSVERLQVRVRGLTDSRHAILCNGVPVPLHPTGTAGEHVAGVRYRAWQPPSCLHPTVGVHSPLVFDIADRWMERSLGGCTYHVSHPGGRSFETFPVNAYEAESRRIARFHRIGHTPGKIEIGREVASREAPLTLDLRWL